MLDKRLKCTIFFTLIAIILLAASFYFKNENKYIMYVDRNLSEEHISIYNTKLLEANILLDTAINNNNIEDQYDILNHIGAQYYGLGNLLKAFEYYEKASILIPEKHVSYKELFKVSVEMKNFDDAKTFIKQAVNNNPKNNNSWLMYIQFEGNYFDNSFENLNDLYNEALIKTNRNVNILSKYAIFNESFSNYKIAIDIWEELSKIRPEEDLYQQRKQEAENKLQE